MRGLAPQPTAAAPLAKYGREAEGACATSHTPQTEPGVTSVRVHVHILCVCARVRVWGKSGHGDGATPPPPPSSLAGVRGDGPGDEKRCGVWQWNGPRLRA